MLSSEPATVPRSSSRRALDQALELLARVLGRYPYLGLFSILGVGAFGLPIPEEVILVAAGLFVHQGRTELLPTLAVCAVGQVLGDSILYFIGRRWGGRTWRGILGRIIAPDRLEQVQARLERQGLWVVFFGRYLTGVRPAVFLSAGAAGIPPHRFLLVDGASAVSSLLAWVTLGWAFSHWIEIALSAVARAEEQILAALLAVVLVLLLERVLVRYGSLAAGSTAARVAGWVRIPLLALTIFFAVLLAREHRYHVRERFLAAAEGGAALKVDKLPLLIETLPSLAPAESPIEIVFVGDGQLLDEALGHAGYSPAAPAAVSFPPPTGPPDRVRVPRREGSSAIGFWRTQFHYRGRPVWFGRFAAAPSTGELNHLSRALTQKHYTLRTAIGPRLGPGSKRRVLYAVLSHPELR